jgi:acetyltransferase EpsM
MHTHTPFDPTAIILYGGGGHGKSLIDLIRSLGTYHLVGIIDDGAPTDKEIMGLPILGGAQVLNQLFLQGIRLAVNGVGGIGNVAARLKVFDTLSKAGFTYPALVHPSAVVEPSARLAPGVQVLAQAYVGSESQIGMGAIINYGAIISHDCILGECTNISPGAMLAGEVQIGDHSQIGMGATINLRLKIGRQVIVGNNATVKADVADNTRVRAGVIWPPSYHQNQQPDCEK